MSDIGLDRFPNRLEIVARQTLQFVDVQNLAHTFTESSRQRMARGDAESVSVSAPAKVLLAGGYLVLDSRYSGLVFALSARMHCHIQPISQSGLPDDEIVVRSPQFASAEWQYLYSKVGNDGGIKVTQLER